MCEGYRAGWMFDREVDEEDDGEKKIACPLLVLWGEKGNVAQSDSIKVWTRWADNGADHSVKGAHFCPEEAAGEVVDALVDLFKP